MAVAKLVVQLDPRKTEHCKEHTPEIHVVGGHHQHGEWLGRYAWRLLKRWGTAWAGRRIVARNSEL